MDKYITEFALACVNNAFRLALHKGKFLPVLEGVMVVVSDTNELMGARVFFEPPIEAVWVSPKLEPIASTYNNVEVQSPLKATFYLFSGVNLEKCENAAIFQNPTVE